MAHLVELSHIELTARPKNKAEDGTAFLPTPLLPCRPTQYFLRLRWIPPEAKTVERSNSAFHSWRNQASGFSAKKVRTSSKNCRKC
jgi:hypothetical protein